MKDLFITNYAEKTTYGITRCKLGKQGDISFNQLIETPGYVTHMVVDSDDWYAVTKPDQNHSGGVLHYRNGQLQNYLEIKGMSFTHCCLDEKKDYLYAVSYHQNRLYSFQLGEEIKIISDITLQGSSINPNRQVKSFPHYVGITPEQKYVYYVDLGADKIRFYTKEEGVLSFSWEVAIEPGFGPRQMIFSTDGKYCYLVSEIANTVQVFEYQEKQLKLLQTVSTIPLSYNEVTHTAAIKLCNNMLYVSNRGHDSVAVYQVNNETGLLWFQHYIMTAKEPRDIEVKENLLVVACQNSNVVEVFEIIDGEDTIKVDEYSIEKPVYLSIE